MNENKIVEIQTVEDENNVILQKRRVESFDTLASN
jgi:hypothetical protein